MNWIRNGRIRPVPRKVGREYFCKPNAEYVDPVAERIERDGKWPLGVVKLPGATGRTTLQERERLLLVPQPVDGRNVRARL
jgi:hypothetical protein